MLIECNDESSFIINIFEPKSDLIRKEQENEYIDKYIETHTDEEFAQDLLSTIKSHPVFFLYFMFLAKLKEIKFVDKYTFSYIMDNVIQHEQELNWVDIVCPIWFVVKGSSFVAFIFAKMSV